MDYRAEYEMWKNATKMSEKQVEILKSMSDEEIRESFYKKLEFGTAGLRGILGLGTNRMNEFTVSQAAYGLGRTVLDHGGEKRGVVIAHDVRHMSKEFSIITAEVLSQMGIKVYLFDDIRPTPMLSFAVKRLKTIAGVVITASHNPKDYNGYKVYWETGAQILDGIANEILSHMYEKNIFEIETMPIEEGKKKGLVEILPHSIDEEYLQKTLDLKIHDELDKDIKVVYTPLNGTGNKPVREVLKRRGFKNIYIVKEQELPDPDFTTVGYPNPEDLKAFKLAKALGKEKEADLLVATDPDCDRIAVMVKDGDSYYPLNGNQMGALFTYYIFKGLKDEGRLPANAGMVKSIVTGNMGVDMAKSMGVHTEESLTGFKNICGVADKWDESKEYKFVFGYEESIGYCYGNHIRDKDGVISAMIAVEMAAYYKKQNKTLKDVLYDLYEEYGYYKEYLQSIVIEGEEGQKIISEMMRNLRENPHAEIAGIKVAEIFDYQKGFRNMPPSNVLIYKLSDGSWFAVRPSGTEPKIKLYIYTCDKTERASEDKLDKIKRELLSILN